MRIFTSTNLVVVLSLTTSFSTSCLKRKFDNESTSTNSIKVSKEEVKSCESILKPGFINITEYPLENPVKEIPLR